MRVLDIAIPAAGYEAGFVLMLLKYLHHKKYHILCTFTDSTVVGLDETDNRLLFIYSQADYESLPLPMNMLERHPDMIITSQLEDSHLYLISRSALRSIKG